MLSATAIYFMQVFKRAEIQGLDWGIPDLQNAQFMQIKHIQRLYASLKNI